MKKAFTLIELIIVVWIIVILIWSISFFKQKDEDKKIKFWKECSNYIFKEIINEKNNFEKNTTINSGLKVLSYLSSTITKDKENESLIINSYYENELLISKELINSDWFCLTEYVSNGNDYTIKPHEEFWINIQKDNIHSNNKEILSVCTTEGNDCLEISKMYYNKANNKFEQQFCSSFIWENCIEWQ